MNLNLLKELGLNQIGWISVLENANVIHPALYKSDSILIFSSKIHQVVLDNMTCILVIYKRWLVSACKFRRTSEFGYG